MLLLYNDIGHGYVFLKGHQVFITEPALLSMESVNGARIMGVQIQTKQQE